MKLRHFLIRQFQYLKKINHWNLNKAIAAGVVDRTISLTTLTNFIGSFFGPIGIIVSLVIGNLVGEIVNYCRKSGKYSDSLGSGKPKIEESFKENKKCIINDFGEFKIDLNVDLKKKLESSIKILGLVKKNDQKLKKNIIS